MKKATFHPSLYRFALAAAVCGSLLAGEQTAYAGACPESLRDRTVEQVASDFFAALSVQDWELVGCHFRRNSYMVSDNGVVRGREELVQGFMALSELFEHAPYDVAQIVTERGTALVLWRVEASFFRIPDGVSTLSVRNGRIQWQTFHAIPTVVAPPPAP